MDTNKINIHKHTKEGSIRAGILHRLGSQYVLYGTYAMKETIQNGIGYSLYVQVVSIIASASEKNRQDIPLYR
jgi:hypothetical protein